MRSAMTVARLTPPFAATLAEYLRMFAKVAQVQFQALLDAFNEHVSRLRGCPEIVEAPKSGYASIDSGAWAGNSWR